MKVHKVLDVAKGAIDHELRVRREHVTLKELIGGGQFGNVYKGILAEPVSSEERQGKYDFQGKEPICVAIKVCKVDNEPADTQLILQESRKEPSFS